MTSICQFFDLTSQYNWDMELMDRSFDPIKITNYLNSFENENDRNFIAEILSKTLYVNYAEFKLSLQQSFEKFRQEMQNTEFYIFTNILEEADSGDWATAILWPLIRAHNMPVKGFITSKSSLPPGKYHLVIFDDGSYSGGNIWAYMDELTFDISKRLNINQEELRSKGYHFYFHVVIPFISNTVLKLYESDEFNMMPWDVIFYNIHNVPVLNEMIDLPKYFPGHYIKRDGDISEYDEVLYERFRFEVPDRPLLYFDNKIAEVTSTYSSVYRDGVIPGKSDFGPLLKQMPSRYKIEELDKLFLEFTNGRRLVDLNCY